MATWTNAQLRNYTYWQARERLAREQYLRTEADEVAEIQRIYRDMMTWCDDEIGRFYGKYAGLEGIDITDAMKKVTSLDIEQYQELAKQYVADRNFSDRANEEMRLYNATMRINRLELLKARIGLHLVGGIDEIDKYCGEQMTDRAIAEYTRLAGILGEDITEIDTALRATEIVNASFKNATYSQRIWAHADNLKSEIAIQLQRGLIAGLGSRQMAANLRKEYDVSRSNAERLMVTELRRVQTDVAIDSYKQEGITQYMYMAVNPNACPICYSLNNKVYDVRGAEVGNPDHPLPPMHPRCHCTIAPYNDPSEYEAWLNWLENGGTTAEWDALDPQEKARLIAGTKPQEPATDPQPTKNIDDCTTVQEVEDLMNNQGWFYKDPRVETRTDLKGCDFESAKSVYRSIKTVFDKYPLLKGELNPVGVGEKRKDVYASCFFGFGRGGVNLNTKFYGNYERFVETYANDTKTRTRKAIVYDGTVIEPETIIPAFHPVGTTAEAIVLHEFGHAIDDYMTYVLKLNGKDKTYSTKLKRSVLKGAGIKNADVKNEVSVYATENTKEFFAECFAEYLNSKSPRRVAAEFGKQLDEELRLNGKL